MYFFSKWIIIVFFWGGLGCIGYIIFSLRSHRELAAKIDVERFRSAIVLLIFFVLFVTEGFLELFIKVFGQVGVFAQIANNLMVGAMFILFLKRLWESITFDA